MRFTEVDSLFHKIGFVEGTIISCQYWEDESGYKKVNLEDPYDFKTCASESPEVLVSEISYDEVVRLDGCTAQIVVVFVELKDGQEYNILFKGEYSSWDDTEFYDVHFAVERTVQQTVWVREDCIEEEEDSWG